MRYLLEIEKRALDELSKLDIFIPKRILKKISKLEERVSGKAIKKLKNKDCYRLRVG